MTRYASFSNQWLKKILIHVCKDVNGGVNSACKDRFLVILVFFFRKKLLACKSHKRLLNGHKRAAVYILTCLTLFYCAVCAVAPNIQVWIRDVRRRPFFARQGPFLRLSSRFQANLIHGQTQKINWEGANGAKWAKWGYFCGLSEGMLLIYGPNINGPKKSSGGSSPRVSTHDLIYVTLFTTFPQCCT